MTKRIPSNIAFNYNPASDFKVQKAVVKYCKRCGQPLVLSTFNADGSVNQFFEFEQEQSIHYGCYQTVVADTNAQLAVQAEEDKRQQQIANDRADAEIERLMREIENGHKP